MGTTLMKEPNIIIYPSPDKVYASNIGLYENDIKTFPTFITKSNRLVLAYDGSYPRLKEQLYEAIARSVWETQMKESLSQQVKGKTEEEIPLWFTEGAIRYFARGWDIAAEDAIKTAYRQNKFSNWEQSISYQPRLSGQAFCYFLAEQYYPQSVMQLYAQLKKKKSLRRSLRLITKENIDSLFIKCHSYYTQRTIKNQDSNQTTQQLNTIIPHKKGLVTKTSISPDQNSIAYIIYRNNTRTVYLYGRQTTKTEKLISYKLPPWISDYSRDIYPLLYWQADSKQLLVTMPEKDKITTTSFNTAGTKTRTDRIAGADGITSLQLIKNNTYLLAAYTKGQSDIVDYNPDKLEYKAYTNDPYDDESPQITQNGNITIISERPLIPTKRPDTLKKQQGIYSIQTNKDKEIQPIATDTIDHRQWKKLLSTNNNQILATHTNYGTERTAIINPDKSVQTLEDYQPVQVSNNTVIQTKTTKDSIYIRTVPLKDWLSKQKEDTITSPWLADHNRRAEEERKTDSMLKAAKDNNPSFLEGVLVPKDAKVQEQKRQDSIKKAETYDPKKVKPYILQLHGAYFTAKINNDYFINRYQPYKNYQGQFKFPELGGMAQGGFSDLFENHHISVGFRLPAGSEGSDFYVKYLNTKKKLDWGLTWFRKVESLNADPKRNWEDENGNPYPNNAKIKTHYYELSLHHPITYDLSLDANTAVRYDRTIFLATDKYTLKFKDIRSIWSITTLSATLNRLQPTIPLLNKGYKLKLTTDLFQPFSGSEGTVTGNTIQIQYHQPIYKYITIVSQLQAAYSGGANKVLYNLGGIDNNVTVRTDSNIHAPQKVPYSFQSLVTPFRGHLQNTMKGNQYLLLNTDIYFPLFQTLIPIETPLQSLNLLQPGLFIDAATAKETWQDPAIKQGWLWSYGISARTSLAGYPIRFDIAWPGTFSKHPVWYFSLNLK